MSSLNLLTIVFITLKLCNIIDWSWWLVMLPSIVLALLFVIAVLIVSIDRYESGKKY